MAMTQPEAPAAPASEHPLARWRKAQGLSQRELADKLRADDGAPLASYASISRIEAGQQPPSFALLLKLFELSGGRLSLDEWVPPAIQARVAAAQARGARP